MTERATELTVARTWKSSPDTVLKGRPTSHRKTNPEEFSNPSECLWRNMLKHLTWLKREVFRLPLYYYESRFMNKLQNDIILLIFKIWKFWNTRFVGNLTVVIYWNFYDNDVITVTSSLYLEPSQYFAQQFSLLLQLASSNISNSSST